MKENNKDLTFDTKTILSDSEYNSPHNNTGRWSKEEHDLFLSGINQYGKDWKKISTLIPTRSIVQIRTHAQKYFGKINNQSKNLFISPITQPSTPPNNDQLTSFELTPSSLELNPNNIGNGINEDNIKIDPSCNVTVGNSNNFMRNNGLLSAGLNNNNNLFMNQNANNNFANTYKNEATSNSIANNNLSNDSSPPNMGYINDNSINNSITSMDEYRNIFSDDSHSLLDNRHNYNINIYNNSNQFFYNNNNPYNINNMNINTYNNLFGHNQIIGMDNSSLFNNNNNFPNYSNFNNNVNLNIDNENRFFLNSLYYDQDHLSTSDFDFLDPDPDPDHISLRPNQFDDDFLM